MNLSDRHYSDLFSFRTLQKVEDPDSEWIDPDYQRIGNDPALNWELNKYNVTPVNDAYRNVYLKFLLMHTKGKLGKHIHMIFTYRVI